MHLEWVFVVYFENDKIRDSFRRSRRERMLSARESKTGKEKVVEASYAE